jgi:hypothetical protein
MKQSFVESMIIKQIFVFNRIQKPSQHDDQRNKAIPDLFPPTHSSASKMLCSGVFRLRICSIRLHVFVLALEDGDVLDNLVSAVTTSSLQPTTTRLVLAIKSDLQNG